MFEPLRRFPIILVTGPQRSGTTICSRMIECDLQRRYIDEERWGVWHGEKALTIARASRPCVLQAPGLLKDVGLFGQRADTAVVVMRRALREIRASQERVQWNVWAAKEMAYYPVDPDSPAHLDPAKWVAWVKYDWWERVGRGLVKNAYEIDYAHLRLHPMWVAKEQRRDFNARQYKA